MRQFTLLLVLTGFLHGESAPSEAGSAVDALSQAQMQEIFQVLRQHYIKPEHLSDEALNRAAVQGLLERLGGGMEIVSRKKSGEAAFSAPLVFEELTPEYGYLRPGTFTIEELTKFDVALDTLSKSQVNTLLLDLRSPAPEGDFTAAAQLLSRFLPDAQTVFQVRKVGAETPRSYATKGKPRWNRALVLLVDAETNNVAEVVAAVLKDRLKPLVVGAKTAGRSAQYQEVPISQEKALRIANGEVVLAGGASLFQHGVEPDLSVSFPVELKRKVFAASEQDGMKKYLFEQERPKNNEAALVAQTNPELEYRVAKSAGQTTVYDEVPLQDPVVRQAIDTLTTHRFLKPIPIPPKKAEPNEAEEETEKKEEPKHPEGAPKREEDKKQEQPAPDKKPD